MKKYLTLIAAFFIMLCLGSVYAWSMIAAQLMQFYQFTASQSQLVFGTLIAIFPLTMIFVGKWSKILSHRQIGLISAVLFAAGQLLAAFSQGHFLAIFIGIGVLVGMATGFGYWLALTTPVAWFPQHKGLVTGISGAGFGLGAVLMSEIIGVKTSMGQNILEVFLIVGISYSIMIGLAAQFMFKKQVSQLQLPVSWSNVFSSPTFHRLVVGMFLGTFGGLIIVGNLTLIGELANVQPNFLAWSITVFAVANFSGRIGWGYLGDRWGSNFSIFVALSIQSIGVLLLAMLPLSGFSFLLLSAVIGFCFGGNFVLFAKKTAQAFGIEHLGVIYPYVFVGYALAGIVGPFTGGYLYDVQQHFQSAILLAGGISMAGSALALSSVYRALRSER